MSGNWPSCRMQLWGEDARDPRAVLHTFAAVRHYVDGHTAPFQRAVRLAYPLLDDTDPSTARACTLLDVLQANDEARAGRPDAAAARYRTLIKREERAHRDLVARAGATQGDVGVLHGRLVLAILHNNLADCLARSGAPAAEIERHYESAITYEPTLTLAREGAAEWLAEREQWTDAQIAFRDVLVARTMEGHREYLNARLAITYVNQANSLVRPEPDGVQQTWGAVDISHVTFDAAPRGGGGTLHGILSGLRALWQREAAPDADDGEAQPTPDSANVSDAPSPAARALEVLEEAIHAVDWTGIPGWKGKVHFETGRILDSLERSEQAIAAYTDAAYWYEKGEQWPDVARALLDCADRLMMHGAAADALRACATAREKASYAKDAAQCRRLQREADARVAIAEIVRGRVEDARQALAALCAAHATDGWESWPGSSSWGPYYDVLELGKAFMPDAPARHRVSVFYHELLRTSAALEAQRDLTAAVLWIYEREKRDATSAADDPGVLKDTSATAPLLNVVTPLAVELSESSPFAADLDDAALKAIAEPTRDRLFRRFGVRFPGFRVRAVSELPMNEYVLLVHEVPVARGTARRVEDIFLHIEAVAAANLVEFLGHQEVQNFLELNKLVIATVEDIAEKENCRHMDPLSAVLRALVSERVPLAEPQALYACIRKQLDAGQPLGAIVEEARSLPHLRRELWGTDGTFQYVMVPGSIERWLDESLRQTVDAPVAVVDVTRAMGSVSTIAAGISTVTQPALVVTRQRIRPIVREMIKETLPDVPVVSIFEIPPGQAAPQPMHETAVAAVGVSP